MDILFALLSIGAGLALTFVGYRIARAIIPLWGFITGLTVGGAVVAAFTGLPLLGAAAGIITGLAVGLALAGLAYFFYGAAVIVLFGSLGYWIGSGLVMTFGPHLELLAGLVGVSMGLVAGIVAVALNTPKYVLVGITALIGAIGTIAGILMLGNQMPLGSAKFGMLHGIFDSSPVWMLATLSLAAAGFIAQTLSTSNYKLQQWTVKPKHHKHLPPPPTYMYY